MARETLVIGVKGQGRGNGRRGWLHGALPGDSLEIPSRKESGHNSGDCLCWLMPVSSEVEAQQGHPGLRGPSGIERAQPCGRKCSDTAWSLWAE